MRGSGPSPYPNPYNNLFIKLKFTAAQIDAFSKIISNNQKQEDAVYQAADSKLSDAKKKELIDKAFTQIENDPSLHNPGSVAPLLINKMDDLLGITPQMQAIKDNTDAQLRQLFSSDANYQYYQDYTKQAGVRFWVINRYGSTLQSAGLPDLSVDQQEALVGIVVQNLHALVDPITSQNHVQQVLDQASAILSPEQVDVLATRGLQGGASLSYARFNYTP